MGELMKKVVAFLGEYKDMDEPVSEDSQLIADLGLNSLTLMEIANDAEDRFSITITDEELASLVTVGDVVRLLDKKGVE